MAGVYRFEWSIWAGGLYVSIAKGNCSPPTPPNYDATAGIEQRLASAGGRIARNDLAWAIATASIPSVMHRAYPVARWNLEVTYSITRWPGRRAGACQSRHKRPSIETPGKKTAGTECYLRATSGCESTSIPGRSDDAGRRLSRVEIPSAKRLTTIALSSRCLRREQSSFATKKFWGAYCKEDSHAYTYVHNIAKHASPEPWRGPLFALGAACRATVLAPQF